MEAYRWMLDVRPVTLARAEPDLLSAWLREGGAARMIPLSVLIALGCGLYGFAIGLGRSPLMAVYVAMKMPLLVFLTLGANGLRTTQADKTSHPSPNLLGSQPAPTRPNQAWVTDICFAALTLRAALRAGCLTSLGSYLPTGEGWLYVAAEMDLYSRRIIGWDTGPSLATELPDSALQRALATRRGHDLRDLLHHSDRGCQYTSHTFRHQLARQGITQSMSRAGNCYDNAAIESFWATLKTECFGSTIPDTRAHARAMLFDYIETFYNPVRLHSSLNFLSPLAFEKSTQLN